MRLARDGSAEHRVGRRANAILLLDDGWSCERVAEVLYLDDDTVRGWRKIYDERGIAGLAQFDAGGSSSRLSAAQEEALKAYVAQALPRTTRQVGAFIEREFGVVYESRAGLIALLHRLGLEYHKPEVIGRKLDAEKQQAFIAAYNDLLNSLGPDEAALLVSQYSVKSSSTWSFVGDVWGSSPKFHCAKPGCTSSQAARPAGESVTPYPTACGRAVIIVK